MTGAVTNNLKAERTLTAEELQTIIDGCEGVTPGPWSSEKGGRGSWVKGSTGEWSAMGCGDSDEAADANSAHIARLDPDTVKAMALELQTLRSQSLSTQQPMGEVTVLEPAIAYQEAEEAICECGAAGSGEGHSDFCPWLESAWKEWGDAFDAYPRPVSALHPNQEGGE